jgi:hypothetical protein
MNEIEFRLERTPVDESDDEIEHDEIPTGKCIAPIFDKRLKHFRVTEGSPVTFTCKIVGIPVPKVGKMTCQLIINSMKLYTGLQNVSRGWPVAPWQSCRLASSGQALARVPSPLEQKLSQRAREMASQPRHLLLLQGGNLVPSTHLWWFTNPCNSSTRAFDAPYRPLPELPTHPLETR